jgi:DNA-directed RNA polymerase specialized sigma24 family protein
MLEDFGELSRDDPRTDEQLVKDFIGGDKPAIEILLTRYQTIILAMLCGNTWFAKDKSYLDDLRQKILITIYLELSKNPSGFEPSGPGSFKKWIYRIAHFKALNCDKKRRKDFKLISEIFSDDDAGIPDDLLFAITPTSTDYEEVEEQLKDISSKLTDEEFNLMKLVCTPMEYADIQKLDEYKDKYSVDALKQKVYNIRKRLRSPDDNRDKNQ